MEDNHGPATAMLARHIQVSPSLQALIEKFDDLLELRAISHHEFLDIRLPKDVFHWPSLIEAQRDSEMHLAIGVMGVRIDSIVKFDYESDATKMQVETVNHDLELGESAYTINNVRLSPRDVKALMIYLFSEFFPCSLNIKEME